MAKLKNKTTNYATTNAAKRNKVTYVNETSIPKYQEGGDIGLIDEYDPVERFDDEGYSIDETYWAEPTESKDPVEKSNKTWKGGVGLKKISKAEYKRNKIKADFKKWYDGQTDLVKQSIEDIKDDKEKFDLIAREFVGEMGNKLESDISTIYNLLRFDLETNERVKANVKENLKNLLEGDSKEEKPKKSKKPKESKYRGGTRVRALIK
tara:strand:- start:1331 stop:1954 length:624 start_codon:yes stop_codon:yes gene_type:complete